MWITLEKSTGLLFLGSPIFVMGSTSGLLRLPRGIGLSCIWGRKHHGYRLRKANRFCFLWLFQMTQEWREKGSWRFQVLLFHCPCSCEHLWALVASQGCAWLSHFLVLSGAGFPCIPLYCFAMSPDENLKLSASPFVKSNLFFKPACKNLCA